MAVRKKKTTRAAKPEREPVHVFGYGDPFSEKSTFLASCPYPGIVWFTDGLGKEAPYLRRFVEKLGCTKRKWRGEEGQPILSLEKDGTELWRIEYYNNMNPQVDCRAYPRLHTRAQRFVREKEYKRFATAGLDSCTGLIDIASEYQQYEVNQGEADELQLRWAANVTNNVHTILKGLSFLPLNVVATAHVQAEKVPVKIGKNQEPSHPTQRGLTEDQGIFVRTIALPGRLGRQIGIVAGKFPEFYRFYVDDDGTARIQTKRDGEWVAGTQINAPDGCRARYSEIWKTQPKGGED